MRAIRDFDANQIYQKEELELAFYMQKVISDENHADLEDIYRASLRYYSEVVLTMKRGEKLETIPPSNIG